MQGEGSDRSALEALRRRVNRQRAAIAFGAPPASILGLITGLGTAPTGGPVPPRRAGAVAALRQRLATCAKRANEMAEKARERNSTTIGSERLSPGELLAILNDAPVAEAVTATRALHAARFGDAAKNVSRAPDALSLIRLSPEELSELSQSLGKSNSGEKTYAALLRRGLELGLEEGIDNVLRALGPDRVSATFKSHPDLLDNIIIEAGPHAATFGADLAGSLIALIARAPESTLVEVALRNKRVLQKARSVDEEGKHIIGRALLELASRKFKPYPVEDGKLHLRCPHTKKTMVDPCISRSGDTYSAVAFDELKELGDPRPDRVARTLLEKYPDGRVPINSDVLDEIVTCPITFETMIVPVIDRFGHAYDLLPLCAHFFDGNPPGTTTLYRKDLSWRAPLAGADYGARETFRGSGLLHQLIWNTESLLEDASARCLDHVLEQLKYHPEDMRVFVPEFRFLRFR